MMFPFLFILSTLFSGLMVARSTPDMDQDLAKLQGTWVVTSLHRPGKVTPADRLKEFGLIVKGRKYYQGQLNHRPDYQDFRIDGSKTPKEIDFFKVIFDSRLEQRGIYKWEEDRLIFCFGSDPASRPAGFREGEYRYKWIFKRNK